MDPRRFEIEFRKLYLPLCMYSLRIVDDIDDARDAVQEAFAKAWANIKDGDEISSFKAYIYRLVRNETINILRKRSDNVGIEEIADIDDSTIDTSERDARIWQAIDRLPERCREVFLLSKRDGFSNEEIAEELGISIKTVKNQMTKAYSNLRETLSDNHKPFFLPFL